MFRRRGGRIRFSAEKPRPDKQFTGLFAWSDLSNPVSSSTKQQNQPVRLVLFGSFEPDVFYDKIFGNRKNGIA